MRDRSVGLDIGASSVKAAQVLRTGPNTYVVEKQAAAPMPRGAIFDGRVTEGNEHKVAAIIKKLFADAGFDTTDVIVGLNSSAGVFMSEEIVPLMRPEDVAKTMPLALEAKNPTLNPKDSQISYTIVEELEGEAGQRHLRVLVYSARIEYVTQIAKVVTAAGLKMVGADLNALAALRAIAVEPRPLGQLDALVDIGSNLMTILLHHNGVPRLLTLDPDAAGQRASTLIADRLGMDEDEPGDADRIEWHKVNDDSNVGLVAQARADYSKSLGAKISANLRNYLDRTEEFDVMANVTLVGGGALLHGLTGVMREALGADLLSYAGLDPNITGPNGAGVERHENQSGGDYLVAIGLGTGARI